VKTRKLSKVDKPGDEGDELREVKAGDQNGNGNGHRDGRTCDTGLA
jgi:hypothetical protein